MCIYILVDVSKDLLVKSSVSSIHNSIGYTIVTSTIGFGGNVIYIWNILNYAYICICTYDSDGLKFQFC